MPPVAVGQENPAVKYWQETFPILSTVLDNFLGFSPICERVCRCWRSMVISYRTAMSPMLPDMANKLAIGYIEVPISFTPGTTDVTSGMLKNITETIDVTYA